MARRFTSFVIIGRPTVTVRNERKAEQRRIRDRRRYRRATLGINHVKITAEYHARTLDALIAAQYLRADQRKDKAAIACALQRMIADL